MSRRTTSQRSPILFGAQLQRQRPAPRPQVEFPRPHPLHLATLLLAVKRLVHVAGNDPGQTGVPAEVVRLDQVPHLGVLQSALGHGAEDVL
jgi:hypothetical protein